MSMSYQKQAGRVYMNRDHREFSHVDLKTGWEAVPGYPSGVWRMTLADSLNIDQKSGRSTRLVRFDAGAVLPRAVLHEHCEEVFLYQGDLVVGCDKNGEGGEVFIAPTYAIRPEQIPHGPFTSRQGCLMLELHYFEESPGG